MLDFGQNWNSVPDWESQKLENSGVSAQRVIGLHQTLVSGDIEIASLRTPSIGWGPIAKGNNYSVRVSRDRILHISDKPSKQPFGWQEAGFATSCADDLFAIFEVSGERCREIFARATTIDWQSESKSASMLFSKLHAIVYRYDAENCLRVHVESPHATYFWTWFEQINLD